MNGPQTGQRRFVTDILLEAGVVTEAQVDAALERQRATGRRIGETLVEMGVVSEEDIAWALARQLGLTFVDVRAGSLDPALVRAFPESVLRRLHVVPIVREEDRLVIAAADPTDEQALAELATVSGARVECVAATGSAIGRALEELLGSRPGRRFRRAAPEPDVRFDVVWERSGEMFLSFHLSLAMRLGASEVHFDHDGGSVHVHHRVGAALVPSPDEPAESMDLLAGRLEAFGMAPPLAAECHDTCSGVVTVDGRERTILASRLVAGERVSVTIRPLRDLGERPTLEGIGMDPGDAARLRQLAARPAGLVLVCGPAGSGCSTSLAALLAEMSTEERRWLVLARDRRLWPAVPGLVDVVTGLPRLRWREVAVAHGMDGLVLDAGLEGARVRSVLGGATHGRWVLARTDWEDTFGLLEWLARHPRTRAALARRLSAVIQQRLSPATSSAAGPPAAFEVLVATDALRAAIGEGATASRLAAVAARDGFRVRLEGSGAAHDAAETGTGGREVA